MQNASFAQRTVSTHSMPDDHRSSQMRNNMQGLGFVGPHGAIPNGGSFGKLHGSKQSVDGASLGQTGLHTRNAMTQQIPFQDSESSFLQGGMAARDHRSRHRRASFSSTESFVTNPDSRVADLPDHTNSFSSVTAETLAAAEQLAVLQQQTHLRQLQLMQQQSELVNGASHLRSRGHSQLHDRALMPPVNIMSDRMASLGGRISAGSRSLGMSRTHEANVSPEIGFVSKYRTR